MNNEESMKINRQAGAEAISAKAMTIAAEHEVLISECVWNFGEDLAHEHAHRLELVTAAKTVRLYFPDLELITPVADSRARRTEERLRSGVAQLLSRIPVPTYTYR